MQLSYKKIQFIISFAEKIVFTIPIPFLFRSVVGYQLRKMCCIAHNTICTACMFHNSCIYGSTFESIIPKDNSAMAGRDRISHPIIIDADPFAGESLDSLSLQIIFLGPAIPHFPYFFYALKQGGEAGVLKDRIPYKVLDVIEISDTIPLEEKRSLILAEDRIETRIQPDQWEYSLDLPEAEPRETQLMVRLLSPLRFKAQGHYVRRLTPVDFAQCLHRRTQVLCSQYGHNDFTGDYQFSPNWTIVDDALEWKDFVHYSARQKKAMQLGGLTGSFMLSGRFSPYEYGMLQFAERFHGGKNTNFGLGKLTVREINR